MKIRAIRTGLLRRLRLILLAVLAGSAFPALAALVNVEVRPGVTVPVWYMKRDAARATLILLPGGSGGWGRADGSEPSSANFLVRARAEFAAPGFNVAIMGRARDMNDLTYEARTSATHLADIAKVVDVVKADTGLPVWLVGTSRGSISAAAAAIASPPGLLAGLVLTASVVGDKPGALPDQHLAALRMPVLLVHHKRDACPVCRPEGLPRVLAALANVPVKKLVMLDGGGPVQGAACEAQHYHGFIGIEKEAARAITDWIAKPTN